VTLIFAVALAIFLLFLNYVTTEHTSLNEPGPAGANRQFIS
jgi:hypothetical protein